MSRPSLLWQQAAAWSESGQALRILRRQALQQGVTPAPKVFLVHGMADTADTWAAFGAAWPTATLWAFELPWSGRGDGDWPHRLPATDWWRAALARCPVAPDVCIGHSFGASVLLDWLHGPQAPALRALVLLSPFYYSPQQRVLWRELDSFANGVPERLARALQVRLAAGSPRTPSVLNAMADMLARRIVPDGLLELFRLFLKSRCWPMEALLSPSLLMAGELDETIVLDSVQRLSHALPRAHTVRLPGCGHHPMHEQPQALVEAVGAFLASHGLLDPAPAAASPVTRLRLDPVAT